MGKRTKCPLYKERKEKDKHNTQEERKKGFDMSVTIYRLPYNENALVT